MRQRYRLDFQQSTIYMCIVVKLTNKNLLGFLYIFIYLMVYVYAGGSRINEIIGHNKEIKKLGES